MEISWYTWTYTDEDENRGDTALQEPEEESLGIETAIVEADCCQ
jgi:hypothetical protein